MITIATFSKPEEAHLLRMKLEAGGVDAYIQDENTVQMDWLLSNAIGGVRVQVGDEDLETAKEILSAPPANPIEAEGTECPDCSSLHTAPDELPRRMAFLSLLVLGFPFPFLRRRWRCADCGHTWKGSD